MKDEKGDHRSFNTEANGIVLKKFVKSFRASKVPIFRIAFETKWLNETFIQCRHGNWFTITNFNVMTIPLYVKPAFLEKVIDIFLSANDLATSNHDFSRRDLRHLWNYLAVVDRTGSFR